MIVSINIHSALTFICSTVHTSRSTDLTLLICVPIERCMPEHLMHKKTPLYSLVSQSLHSSTLATYKFHEAHLGSTTHCQHIKPKPAGTTHHFVYNPRTLCSLASSGAPSAPLHVSPSSPCPVSLASCVVVVVRQT